LHRRQSQLKAIWGFIRFAAYSISTTQLTALAHIAGDGSDYASKTAGYDPMLRNANLFNGIRMRFYASADDVVVGKTENSDAMNTLVTGHATETEVVACTGTHGDPSHFQASDYVSFLDRCI
jgi:hypothetical protein